MNAPVAATVDENGRDDGVSGTGLKAYVPSKDHRLVLSAIDNQLNIAKDSWKEKHGNDNNKGREEFFMDCIDKTGTSLKQQLESVTIPADEAEVERVLDSFQTRLLSTRPFSNNNNIGNDNDDDDDDDESLSSVDDENEEIEFDDNEIVDQDAYNQVKQLRARARDISSRVISIREETMGKAFDITRRDISELMRVHGFTETVSSADGGETQEQNEDDNEEKRDSLNPMHVALQTLTSSLQNVDTDLADKLESLKETIGTIDSSVEKYQRMSQGDESVLSKTEKALLASEEPRRTVVESLDENDSPMNPDKNLARLLAGVL